jgi:hypothetical protein
LRCTHILLLWNFQTLLLVLYLHYSYSRFVRDVLQSYWTSDGLPLYCSQPTGEKTHTNQQCERLVKIRQTMGNIEHIFWMEQCSCYNQHKY